MAAITKIVEKYPHRLICLFLVLSTVLVYWQVRDHDFVVYDDNDYVYANPHIQQGVTVDSVVWAFTNEYAANWHPVTWISHMVDYSLYGADPAGHLLTNLAIHIINSLLLYLVFWRMTGAPWRSGFVAALFALHPLHVESVAWVSERKDLLSGFWGLLTIFFYHRYTIKKGVAGYLPVFFCYMLGLMSKPMLVTLPLLLLFLDFWPLERIQVTSLLHLPRQRDFRYLVREKVPLFVLAVASSIVTLLAQGQGGALQTLAKFSPAVRLQNAVVAYGAYLGKMILPVGLAPIYPHPGAGVQVWQVAASLVVLLVFSVAAVKYSHTRKFLLFGWLWYLVSLLPVIGIVQVGFQAMADRYTYLPLIGMFVILAWALPDSLLSRKTMRTAAASAGGIILAVLMVVTYRQAGFWQNSYTLFNRALAVTQDNYVAYNHLGLAEMEEGKAAEALLYFEKTLEIKPDHYGAWDNLGMAKLQLGKTDEAISALTRSVELAPTYFTGINNLGLAYYVKGDFEQARKYFHKALELEPDNAKILDNLGGAYLKLGQLDEAEKYINEAVKEDSNYAEAHFDLALLYLQRGDLVRGVDELKKTLELDPDFGPARKMMDSLRRQSEGI